MLIEIAEIKISSKSAEELKEKVGKALDDIQKKRAQVEKELRLLKKQERALQKFLGIAPKEETLSAEIGQEPTEATQSLQTEC